MYLRFFFWGGVVLCVSLQFDNLYIDMNGIIHPCSHPEDKPPPESEEEMYKNIMDYVDRYLKWMMYVCMWRRHVFHVLEVQQCARVICRDERRVRPACLVGVGRKDNGIATSLAASQECRGSCMFPILHGRFSELCGCRLAWVT